VQAVARPQRPEAVAATRVRFGDRCNRCNRCLRQLADVFRISSPPPSQVTQWRLAGASTTRSIPPAISCSAVRTPRTASRTKYWVV